MNNKVKIFLMTAFDIVDLKNNEDFKKAKNRYTNSKTRPFL